MAKVYVEDGRLKKNGRDVREFGVNTPDLLVRWLGSAVSPKSPWSLTSPFAREQLFKVFADSGIHLVRFAPFGHYPLTYKASFLENESRFLDAFDKLVDSAERYQIELIPSLFFSQTQIPPIFNETLGAFAVNGTRSYDEFERVIDTIVPRYRSSKAIGYWEFGRLVAILSG